MSPVCFSWALIDDHRTLEEQLASADATIADCARRANDPAYPDRSGAALGWIDAVYNRELILGELENAGALAKQLVIQNHVV